MQLKLTKDAAWAAKQVLQLKGDCNSRVQIRMVKRLISQLKDGEPCDMELDESQLDMFLAAVTDVIKRGINGAACSQFGELLDAIEPLEKK